MTGTVLGIALVFACALLEGLGQVFLKKSVLTRVRWFSWISIGVAFLALEVVLYTEALKLLNVSVAFTLLSMNLIAIALLSQWILREKVTKTRWIGVVLIFAGAVLVMARTV
jgi:undecaprenyl phosphate-alpha-L-ara4N flippase subunit ArnE